jgi:hypothetical protein
MVMRARRVALITAVASALALSCQVLLGIPDGDLSVAPPTPDASEEAAPRSCVEPLPRAPNATPGDRRAYYFALRDFALAGDDFPTDAGAPSDAGRPLGFDLDGVCTCSGSQTSEDRASCISADGGAVRVGCDLDGGVDNALLRFTESFTRTALDGLNKSIMKEFSCGRTNLVFALLEYNGLADDDNVKLYPVPSYGIHEPHDGETDGGLCAPTFGARFDGTDRWSISNVFISMEGEPSRPSFSGYVKDWQLVVDGRLPTAAVFPIVGVGGAPLTLSTPVLVAKLAPANGGFAVTEGLVGGRAGAIDVLRSFGELVPEKENNVRNCNTNAVAWEYFRSELCNARDVMATATADFTNVPCDGLAFVVRFTAAPVLFKSDVAEPFVDSGAAPCASAALECP